MTSAIFDCFGKPRRIYLSATGDLIKRAANFRHTIVTFTLLLIGMLLVRHIEAFMGVQVVPMSALLTTKYFFRPGLTWPRRTNGLSFRALPAGSVFADKGPVVFVSDDDHMSLLALAAVMNSRVFYLFVLDCS